MEYINKWIKTTEREPEEDGSYLCRVSLSKYGAEAGLTWTAICEYRNGMWWSSSAGATYVTHWMPLPKPPMEDENETD